MIKHDSRELPPYRFYVTFVAIHLLESTAVMRETINSPTGDIAGTDKIN